MIWAERLIGLNPGSTKISSLPASSCGFVSEEIIFGCILSFFRVRLLFPSPEISIVLGVRLMVKSGPFSADGRPELQSADPLTVGENQIKLLVCCLIS